MKMHNLQRESLLIFYFCSFYRYLITFKTHPEQENREKKKDNHDIKLCAGVMKNILLEVETGWTVQYLMNSSNHNIHVYFYQYMFNFTFPYNFLKTK